MKQHPLCSDCEDKITPMDLPIPSGLKKEWSICESRRQFLGRFGKVLGWASLATLFGEASFRHLAFASGANPQAGLGENSLGLPHFAPKAKRAIYLFMSGAPPQVDLFDYKPNLASAIRQRHACLGSRQPAIDRDDRRSGPFSRCSCTLAFQSAWANRNLDQRFASVHRAHGGRSHVYQVDQHRCHQP